MHRGTLGESESEVDDTSELNFDHTSRSSIRNPYDKSPRSKPSKRGKQKSVNYRTRSSLTNRDNEPSTSNATASKRTSSRPVTGAARRKMTYRQRQLKQLKEITKLQNTTNLLIPKAPFARVVREISLQINPDIQRYTLTALESLHEATEMFITQLFQDSYMLTMHRKCVTLSIADMMLIRSLKLNF